ncbi:MAG: hypothetical protein IH606_19215 [Burkholderiales bacterium]|nr:hypothetical protein [Burkholderiales bacterium]
MVTDLAMPRLNGLDLARTLLALRPDLPVNLHDGYAERLTGAQTRGSGMRAFVAKPIDIGAFFTLIEGRLKWWPCRPGHLCRSSGRLIDLPEPGRRRMRYSFG